MQKVLIITYYWDPAGGPGAQRWLKFVKYLRRFGVEPVLYVPQNPFYPQTDASLYAEVPSDIRVYRGGIFEPNAWASRLLGKKGKKKQAVDVKSSASRKGLLSRAMLWIRANLFIPDARMFWIRPSVGRIEEILNKEGIGTVISTGPPHSCHVIAHRVKKRNDVRWVADFRDPWTKIDYFHHLPLSNRARKKHLRLESEILNGADAVIAVTPSMAKDFGHLTTKPIHVITNGYDAEDFLACTHPVPVSNLPADIPIQSPSDMGNPAKKFTLAHFGSLDKDRNPYEFWEVLSQMASRDRDFADDLQIILSGDVCPEVFESIEKNGLTQYLSHHPYLPHERVVAMEKEAGVLLLVMYRTPSGHMLIMGKLFEYLAARRPVLAVGYAECDAAQIIRSTQSGQGIDFADKAALKYFMQDSYKRFKDGTFLLPSSQNIGQYTRENLTRRLVDEVLFPGNKKT